MRKDFWRAKKGKLSLGWKMLSLSCNKGIWDYFLPNTAPIAAVVSPLADLIVDARIVNHYLHNAKSSAVPV